MSRPKQAYMITRFSNYLKFQVERFILRGTFHRLLFIAILIVLVSGAGGLMALWATTGFETSWDAIWWAFLRLTDPGYLGDDEGTIKRGISTMLTVLGYVLFMGALIAIMTQWLHETIATLQSGLTPIAQKNHFLILGWSDRTPVIVEQLLQSKGRMQRFLSRFGEDDLKIVILAEKIGPHLVQGLKDHLGARFHRRQITLRSGLPIYVEHLERVDFLRAAAILMPAESSPTDGAVPDGSSDSRVIKTLLSVAHATQESRRDQLPLMVAEINDTRNIPIATHAYGGPIEILPVNQIISRLIAQNLRHRGLSRVFAELFSQVGGNQIYIRACPEVAERRFEALPDLFPQAIVLGLIEKKENQFEPEFRPRPGYKVSRDHRFIFLAKRFEDCVPDLGVTPELPVAGTSLIGNETKPPQAQRRVLILGWNQKAPTLIKEFDSYENESFELTVLSMAPEGRRKAMLRRHDAAPARLQLHHLDGDYTSMSDLAKVRPETFDHIVLLASDRMESEGEAEARAIHGYLVLQEVLGTAARRPEILVELMTSENVGMFEQRGDEVIVTPEVLSHVLTQVAMRRELRSVVEVLFGPGGAEVSFRPAREFARDQETVTFRQVQRLSASRDEIALGFRIRSETKDGKVGVRLNPEKDLAWKLSAEDEVVVISGF